MDKQQKSSKKLKTAAVISKGQDSEVTAGYVQAADRKVDKLIAKIDARQEWDRAEKLAGSARWVRNHTFHDLVDKFPHHPHIWSVERFFPNSPQGPIAIEEPVLEYQIERCESKRAAIEALGVRYLVLTPNMDEQEDQEALAACQTGQIKQQP